MNNTLPQVSAEVTADLRDVHTRLAESRKFSYWRGFMGEMTRVYVWAHSFWPRWF